jgi:hypothetical protein
MKVETVNGSCSDVHQYQRGAQSKEIGIRIQIQNVLESHLESSPLKLPAKW